MRIFVIGTRGFPGVQGGIEKHCEELYSRLASNKELDITVIALGKYCDTSVKNWGDIKFEYIKSINSKSFEKLCYAFKASLYAIIKRADIVHFQGLNSALYIPLIKLFNLKVVFTHHSRDYLYPKWSILGKMILKMSEKAALRSDKIIAISELIDNHLKKNTDKSIIIHNGVSLKHLEVSEDEERFFLNKYGLTKKGYIFFAGRFTPEKAIEDLINAYCQLNDTRFKLVIAGDAEHESKYSRMIKDHAKKSKNIILTGFITGKELQTLFLNAKLFVLPSKQEGFPIALLEALSYGVEVIVSDIEANLQINLDKNNFFRQGDVENLKEKISHFLNSDISEEERLRRFKLLEEDYNWDKIAIKTYGIYKELLQI